MSGLVVVAPVVVAAKEVEVEAAVVAEAVHHMVEAL